ncbi:hypothetical protein LZC95_24460 [Pendulispora brunnea]|uniref:Lipoprotein n=1 Tax=Pendulispora brunnea TaxID=2905690 RepID=A0ABZ2KN32_9BACT
MSMRIRQWATVVACVGLATCSNLDNIDVDAQGEGTIPAATPLETLLSNFDLGAFNRIDFSQSFKNQGASKDDVDSVRVKSFQLSIPAPPGQTFDFLQSVAFYAESSGQPRVRIAHLDAVPRGASSLQVSIDPGVELKPYVVAPQMSITTEATGSRPQQESTVKAEVTLDVDIHTGCE